jgi:two-component sensor histidine kinase
MCWFWTRCYVVKNKEGEIYRLAGISKDITERKRADDRLRASLREKEVMLKEIHHRVKNNLQIISSLLDMQARKIADPAVQAMLAESRNRVRSMALIHEQLYQSHDLAGIELDGYVRNLAESLLRSYRIPNQAVALKVEIDKISLDINRSIPCALILNELLSNALKHAFPPNLPSAQLSISMTCTADQQYRLEVHDNGVGFPTEVDFRATRSLGMQLVNTLVSQLEGTIALERSGGTRFVICFPILA